MMNPTEGQTVYVLYVADSGREPYVHIEEAVVDSVVPGFGITRTVSGKQYPAESKSVFETEKLAAAAAAARMRSSLAQISISYEKKIEELEALANA